MEGSGFTAAAAGARKVRPELTPYQIDCPARTVGSCEGRAMHPETWAGGFQITPWTLLGHLKNGDDSQKQNARERIAQVYWGPVYAFLRRSGCGREEAEELTQGFFAE